MAQDVAKTMFYLEKAGEQALAAGADQQAIVFFGRALELDSEGPESRAGAAVRGRWERRLGEANLRLGRMPECRAHLHQAVGLLGFPMPQKSWRLLFGLARQIARQLLHRLRPSWFLGREPGERREILEAAGAYDRLMRVGYFSHDTLGMFYAALRNINLAERAGPSPELVTAYASLYGIAGLIPLRRLAEAYALHAYSHAEEHTDRGALLWLLTMDAIYRLGIADWDKAWSLSMQGEDLVRQSGAVRDLEDFLGVQSMLCFFRGDFAQAESIGRRKAESGARRGDPQSQLFGWLLVAQAQLATGACADAQAVLAVAQRLLDQDPGRTLEIFYKGLLARISLANGKPEEAGQAADGAAAQISLGPPLSWYLIHAYVCVAEVRLELWRQAARSSNAERKARARAARRSCLAVWKCAKILPASRPQAYRVMGTYYWANRHEGKARTFWTESVRHAQELRMPWDETLARNELARQTEVT